MKLRAVQMDDEDVPASITVEMTTDEAAVIYAFLGSIAPKAVTDAAGDVRWGNALYDVADCLSASFFNRFWDEGAKAVAPRLTPSVGS
jgi:hypothetical protein